MAKTTAEKIASKEDKIKQLENERKQLMQKQKAEERKARDRRLYRRHALLESMLPDTIDLTDEQFTAFLKQSTANEHGRRALAKIVAQDGATPAPAKVETKKQAAPAPPGSDSGEPKGG